ncbi:MAG: N-acetyltransferase [Deltaproteobacteria bacterium]|nr:N-acetyltransferase [Deltaproteobacteria bacterium]
MTAEVPTEAPSDPKPDPKPGPKADPEADPKAEPVLIGKPPENLPKLGAGPATRRPRSAAVTVEEVDLRKTADRKLFLGMVEPIYRGDPNFIMPLWMERMAYLDPGHNPAFKDLEVRAMVAKKAGKVVGRITAHLDHAYDRIHETRAGWFGFFESIDDEAVAHALFDEATSWLVKKGAKDCIGPMNFNTNGQCGLLVSNFDRPAVIEMTYNPPYYEKLITSFGFAKAKDLYAWWIDISKGTENPKVARIAKVAERVRKREGVTLRTLRKSDFQAEVALLFELYNQAWEKNWGFVPTERAQFEQIAKDLKPIFREELALVVELNGKPVGFALTLPNVNEVMPKNGRLFPFGWVGVAKLALGLTTPKHARLMVLGMLPAYRKRGLESLLFLETALRAKAIGVDSGEISWTLEDNHLINRAIESMDGKLDRTYRLFGLDLT